MINDSWASPPLTQPQPLPEASVRVMRYARALVLTLLVVFASSAVTAASATAAPEFLHSGKEVVNKSVKIQGKTVKMYVELGAIKYYVTCSSSTSEGGEINGTTEVRNVKARFKGCLAKESEELHQCSVRSFSPSGAEGEVITKTLKGKLGEVATSEATSEVGLKLEPASGFVYVTLTGSTECLPAETVEAKGSLIGEVTPIGGEGVIISGQITYKTKEEKHQLIRKFKGESAVHELEYFEIPIAIESEDKVEYGEKVVVTL